MPTSAVAALSRRGSARSVKEPPAPGTPSHPPRFAAPGPRGNTSVKQAPVDPRDWLLDPPRTPPVGPTAQPKPRVSKPRQSAAHLPLPRTPPHKSKPSPQHSWARKSHPLLQRTRSPHTASPGRFRSAQTPANVYHVKSPALSPRGSFTSSGAGSFRGHRSEQPRSPAAAPRPKSPPAARVTKSPTTVRVLQPSAADAAGTLTPKPAPSEERDELQGTIPAAMLHTVLEGAVVIRNMDVAHLKQCGEWAIVNANAAVAEDLAALLNHPRGGVVVTSLGGAPLTCCYEIRCAEGDDQLAVARRGAAAYAQRDMPLPTLCRLYTDTAAMPVRMADVDFSRSWLVPVAPQAMAVGCRVQREPAHWKWGEQDGGAGGTGTVLEADTSGGWVVVRWDANGEANRYRYGGVAGVDDVKLVGAQVPAEVPKSPQQPTQPPFQPEGVPTRHRALSVGARVRRNPRGWQASHGDADGGAGGIGTVVAITGEGMTVESDAGPAPSGERHASVRWDAAPEVRHGYRWHPDDPVRCDVVALHHPAKDVLVEARRAPAPGRAVRCVRVTVLSSRGVPGDLTTCVEASMGGAAEATSDWQGDNPAWGETLTLDVPAGEAGDLTGQKLTLTLFAKKRDTEKEGSPGGDSGRTPLGGCDVELGHLVNPTAQTLWVAMDARRRSSVVASPTTPGRSLQSSIASESAAWLRVSIGFTFAHLQQRAVDGPVPPVVPPSGAPAPAPSPAETPRADPIDPPRAAHEEAPQEASGRRGGVQVASHSHYAEREVTVSREEKMMSPVRQTIPAAPVLSHALAMASQQTHTAVRSCVSTSAPSTPRRVTGTPAAAKGAVPGPPASAAESASARSSVRRPVTTPRFAGSAVPVSYSMSVASTAAAAAPPPLLLEPLPPVPAPPSPSVWSPGARQGELMGAPLMGYAPPALHPVPVVQGLAGAPLPVQDVLPLAPPPALPPPLPYYQHALTQPDPLLRGTPHIAPPRPVGCDAIPLPGVLPVVPAPGTPSAHTPRSTWTVPATTPGPCAAGTVVPAEGDATSVVEYLVQLAFDPVTVLEVARSLKRERVETVGTLRMLTEGDLQAMGVPLGCRRRIARALPLSNMI
eukprot:TRINITY_DN16763_c0_g1_i1.p1 TRINITY_DN16763_c0_g1~~TRINITY_DN16763_c0_g1_i1.p1  ORF type:complete len:1099 (+),score=122.56 TRINITY_DN16763_c0_g1_i1:87-3383(+)